MTAASNAMNDYFATENLETANGLVARILSENDFEQREIVKDDYTSIKEPEEYSMSRRDWSAYTTHYLKTSRSPENPMYTLWSGIRSRCYNSGSMSYDYYGGRGITMHDEWKNSFNTFANDVLRLIGKKPHPYYTIDRINNDEGYVPGNIRWAPPLKQAHNRNNLKISETNGLVLATLYKYYKTTGKELRDVYNNYLAESEDRKLTKGWSAIYGACKAYNMFV